MGLLKINISLSSMIILILIFRWILKKKISKGMVMFFWNLVLLRAIFPFSISAWDLPFLKDWQKPHMEKYVAEIPKMWSNISLPQAVPMEIVQQEAPSLHAADYLKWVWIAGAFCLMMYFLIVYIREQQALRSSVLSQNHAARRIVYEYSFRRRIRLYESRFFETPVTFGVVSPKILLPVNSDAATRVDMRNMIAHEMEHIRTFDVGKRYVMVLALCIHWFNPLVWLMYRLYQMDQEMACDERVMKKMSEKETKNYIYTMIKMTTEKKSLFTMTTGFGGKAAGKKRILQALGRRKKGMASAAAAVLLGICLLSSFVSFSRTEVDVASLRKSESSADMKQNVAETEEEQEPELIEPKFDEVIYLFPYDESFDYDGVMPDMIDNYNDVTQPLTPDQEKALIIQNGIKLAKIYKRLQKQGRELRADEIWTVEEYGTVRTKIVTE